MSEAELPPFLLPYLPQFRALLEDLDLVEGFVIYPVEVSGHDIARGLANWMGEHGRTAHFVAPTTESEFRDIAPSLLALHPKESELVVFAGPPLLDADSLPPGFAYGLHLLNQRRDSIKEQFGVPLLWCGPKVFLAATAERAPDFWSVRDLGGKVTKPSERDVWRLPGTLGFPYRTVEDNEEPEKLRTLYAEARRQGDTSNAAHFACLLLNFLIYRLELAEADRLCDEVATSLGNSPKEINNKLYVLNKKAQLLHLQNKTDEALDLLRKTIIPLTKRHGIDVDLIRVQQNLADILADAGKDKESLEVLQRLESDARAKLDPPSFSMIRGQIARQLSSLGKLREAERILLKEVLPVIRRIGDARSVAISLGDLAQIYARAGRLDEAISLLRNDVLPTQEAIRDILDSIWAHIGLADCLIQRGHRDDLFDARNILVKTMRDGKRHRLDTHRIHELLVEVDRKLAQ